MKAGLSGTSCLAPGFDTKQMMTPSVTAPSSQTHMQEHRGNRTRIRLAVAAQAHVPEDRRVTHTHARAPTVFTHQRARQS